MTSPPLGYRPQLDGVRAIAILAVLLAHFGPVEGLIGWHLGRIGILLFFVLSGFLITSLLLKSRESYEEELRPKRSAFATFYARRILRIFPIYYATILYFWSVGYRPIADHLGWHLTYTSNIATAYFGIFFYEASHLWSLCVEEQFYLLWPAVILMVPRRRLFAVISSVVALGVLYKGFCFWSGLGWTARSFVGGLEPLGMGSMLALLGWRPVGLEGLRPSLDRLGLFLGIPAFALITIVGLQNPPWGADPPFVYVVAADLAAAFAFLPLVIRAAEGSNWGFGKFLALGPIRYLGKISYGVYLYHQFLLIVLEPLWLSLGVSIPRYSIIGFLVYSGAAIVFASISWQLIERPINSLKERFPYERPSVHPPPTSS